MEQITNFENQNLVPITPQKNIFKILFFILLALFLIIASVLTILLITKTKSQPSSPISETNQPLPVSPTAIPTITDETANWKNYEDKTSGLSFKYPKDWSVGGSYPNGVTIQSSDFKSEKSFYKISNGSFVTIYFNPPTSAIKDDDESLIKYASIYTSTPGRPAGSEFVNFNGERAISFYYPVAGENLNSGNAYIFIKDNKAYTLNQEYRLNSDNPSPELLEKILFDLKIN